MAVATVALRSANETTLEPAVKSKDVIGNEVDSTSPDELSVGWFSV